MNILFFTVVFTYILTKLDKRSFKRHPDFINGSWTRTGRAQNGEPWHITYVFDKYRYSIKAVPHFEEQGSYKVLKEVENLLILQTNNVHGEEDKQPYLINIGVDQKANELNIDNRIFKRLS